MVHYVVVMRPGRPLFRGESLRFLCFRCCSFLFFCCFRVIILSGATVVVVVTSDESVIIVVAIGGGIDRDGSIVMIAVNVVSDR